MAVILPHFELLSLRYLHSKAFHMVPQMVAMVTMETMVTIV